MVIYNQWVIPFLHMQSLQVIISVPKHKILCTCGMWYLMILLFLKMHTILLSLYSSALTYTSSPYSAPPTTLVTLYLFSPTHQPLYLCIYLFSTTHHLVYLTLCFSSMLWYLCTQLLVAIYYGILFLFYLLYQPLNLSLTLNHN